MKKKKENIVKEEKIEKKEKDGKKIVRNILIYLMLFSMIFSGFAVLVSAIVQ